MRERVELIGLLLTLTPEELEQTITLFESERTQPTRAGASPHHQTET